MNKFVPISLIAPVLLVLTACGGSGGGGTTPLNPTTQTGIFLDSPVINIGYRTETLQGVTTANGEYDYLDGETVTFFIGNLEFPATTAANILTPLEIAGAQDTADTTVINMLRLLQTLDDDNDPSNGIQITEDTKTAATDLVDFTLTIAEFESSTEVTDLVALITSTDVLVDENSAVTHFEEQLANLPLIVELRDFAGVVSEATLVRGTLYNVNTVPGVYTINDTDLIYTLTLNADGSGTVDFGAGDINNVTWSVNGAGSIEYTETDNSGGIWNVIITSIVDDNFNMLIDISTPADSTEFGDVTVLGNIDLAP